MSDIYSTPFVKDFSSSETETLITESSTFSESSTGTIKAIRDDSLVESASESDVNIPDLDDLDIDELLSKAKETIQGNNKNLSPNDDDEDIQRRVKNIPTLDVSKGSLNLTTKNKVTKLINNNNINNGDNYKIRKINDPVLFKQQKKVLKNSTTGPSWFNMPKAIQTPELKRDLELLKLRNVLDPKRHYKKMDKNFGEFIQVGTIIEGNTEYYSARMSNKERKKTITAEVLSDENTQKFFKKKYDEIQAKSTSGRKAFYKKLKAKRNKF